jgi:hypothetical protein
MTVLKPNHFFCHIQSRMKGTAYCSPSHEKNYQVSGTCFSKGALLRMARAWNEYHVEKDKIRGVERMTAKELWKELNQRMSDICGSRNDICWVDHLKGVGSVPEVKKSIAPKQPKEWSKNPRTWLTNYDIADVMNQYDISQEPSYQYKFLGVYPIDFQASSFGQCLFNEICSLEILPLIKKGIRYLGLITNLDKHNQDGSHWTSLFIVLDPKLPSFGAWYYDSVGSKEPVEITQFKTSLKAQVEKAHEVFGSVIFNTTGDQDISYRHQYKNTECGMFSIDYQLRWLKSLKKNARKTIFKDIVDIPLRDDDVWILRSKYFRPIAGGGYRAKKLRSKKIDHHAGG